MSALTLADLAAQSETVTVAGKAVAVQPLSLAAIAAMQKRFPDYIRDAEAARNDPDKAADFDIPEGLVGLVLAAALGHVGDPTWEAAVLNIAPHEQAAIFAATMKMTEARLPGPFAARSAGTESRTKPKPGGGGKPALPKSRKR